MEMPVKEGMLLLASGDLESAIDRFNQALQEDPSNAIARVGRGRVLAKRGQYTKAIQDYTRALESDPVDGLTYRHRGDAWANLNRIDLAAADYVRAIRLNPYDGLARLLLAWILLEKKESKNAWTRFNEALQLGADRIEVLTGRGEASFYLGNYAAAVADLKEVVRENPSCNKSRIIFAQALSKLGDMPSAERILTQVMGKNAHEDLYYTRGVIRYEVGDLNGALKDFLSSGNTVKAALGVAQTCYSLGKIKECEIYCDKIIEQTVSVGAWILRAECRLKRNNWKEAVADLTEAINKEGGERAYHLRGLAHCEMGMMIEAEADFTASIEKNPQNAVSWWKRGEIRLNAKETQTGLADLLQALVLDNSYAAEYCLKRAEEGVCFVALAKALGADVNYDHTQDTAEFEIDENQEEKTEVLSNQERREQLRAEYEAKTQEIKKQEVKKPKPKQEEEKEPFAWKKWILSVASAAAVLWITYTGVVKFMPAREKLPQIKAEGFDQGQANKYKGKVIILTGKVVKDKGKTWLDTKQGRVECLFRDPDVVWDVKSGNEYRITGTLQDAAGGMVVQNAVLSLI